MMDATIKDVQIRYCRACDRADFDLLRDCFHPDATTSYGFFGGSVDDFIASAKQQLPMFLRTTHNTGNQIVEVNGMEGDTITLTALFAFDFGAGLAEDGTFLGTPVPTGLRPRFLDRLRDQGVIIPDSVFLGGVDPRGAR